MCCLPASCCPPSPLQAALTKASRMKDRFHELFIMDEGRNPRTWHPREDIPKIACSARAAAANVLAQLAVIRRPEQLQQRDAAGDVVERAVLKLVQQVGREGACCISMRLDGCSRSWCCPIYGLLSCVTGVGMLNCSLLFLTHCSHQSLMKLPQQLISDAPVTVALCQWANCVTNTCPPPLAGHQQQPGQQHGQHGA